jgi:pathogenesis-related protein 1
VFPRVAPILALAALVACGSRDEVMTPAGSAPPPGFAADILAEHNAARARAAPTPSPALAPLAWGADPASNAQAWAGGCSYQHNPNLGSRSLGENIAATAPPGAFSAAQVVDLWESEKPFYDYATNTCDTANVNNVAHTCGHYTQLVWRTTTVVGCAQVTCSTGSPFQGVSSWDFWVCDYAPPGNFVGQRPY